MMPISLDASVGNEPIRAFYDALYSQWIFRVEEDGEVNTVIFDCRRMPFTLIDVPGKGMCADRELVIAHSGKQAKHYHG